MKRSSQIELPQFGGAAHFHLSSFCRLVSQDSRRRTETHIPSFPPAAITSNPKQLAVKIGRLSSQVFTDIRSAQGRPIHRRRMPWRSHRLFFRVHLTIHGGGKIAEAGRAQGLVRIPSTGLRAGFSQRCAAVYLFH